MVPNFLANLSTLALLTLCHQAMQKCYPMRCWRVTHLYIFLHDVLHIICQMIWLNYRFKVIHSLLQDAWVSCYKQTEQSRPPIFRTIWLQQRDHSFRYSLCFPSVAIIVLRRNVLQGTTFCVSYMRIHILMSLIIVTMKVWTVTVMPPQLVHINNCDLLIHWLHNFHTHFSSHQSRQFL